MKDRCRNNMVVHLSLPPLALFVWLKNQQGEANQMSRHHNSDQKERGWHPQSSV
jgi:hypothetical protein